MNKEFTIFVVDDDPIVIDIISSILEEDNAVVCFDSAEACQEKLATDKPDFFLLDISLPGLNGYDLCRFIKDDASLAEIPVTFISSHDTIEARLQGYDSGGEDFIVKPFSPDEVLRKVKVAKAITSNKQSLQEQTEAAEYLSTIALASMDESGLVLQFMSKLIAMDTDQDVADGLIELMQRFRLEGVVQTRLTQRTHTFSAAGPNIPLEESVLDHVKTLGRIFEFHTRGVHNFDRVTLMVNNMPLQDPDFCGRLRDHLSVAAQGADSRLRAIEIEETNRRNKAGILSALNDIGESISIIGQANQMDHERSITLINELQDRLVKSFVNLGLTSDQEEFVERLIHGYLEQLTELIDHGKDNQSSLKSLQRRLQALSSD